MTANIERIVGRAIVDQGFRAQLLVDPERAARLAGVSLSAAELDQLKSAAAKAARDPQAAERAFTMQGSTWS